METESPTYPCSNVGRLHVLFRGYNSPTPLKESPRTPAWESLVSKGSTVLLRPRHIVSLPRAEVGKPPARAMLTDVCVIDGEYEGVYLMFLIHASVRRRLEFLLAASGVHVAAATLDPENNGSPDDVTDPDLLARALEKAHELGWDAPLDPAVVLGETVRVNRKNALVSQEALARTVGLDQSAISQIESGKRSVGALELKAIAEALHVNIADMLM